MKPGSTQTKDILFLSLDWYRTKDPKTPLAIASIEAYFRQHFQGKNSVEFRSFDIANEAFDLDQVQQYVLRSQPKIIGIGVYIWNESLVQQLLPFIRMHFPNCTLILGGPQITYGNEDLESAYPGADFLVKGAGEKPFLELCHLLEQQPKENLKPEQLAPLGAFRAGHGAVQPLAHEVDLAGLPSPFLSGTHPLKHKQTFVRWETMRGCPYRCSFCQFRVRNGQFAELSLERIFKELELFHRKKVQSIAVLDPIFNLNRDHYLPILRKIESLGMDAHFSFQCRLELLTKEHGKEFIEFCRRYQNITLEFGVQTFVQAESKAIQRNNHPTQIERAIALLNSSEIDFDLHLIFGLPGQTFESFQTSYTKALAASPSRLFLFPLNILRGTQMADQANQSLYTWDPKDHNIILSTPWMTSTEIFVLKKLANQVNTTAKQTLPGQRMRAIPFASLAKAI